MDIRLFGIWFKGVGEEVTFLTEKNKCGIIFMDKLGCPSLFCRILGDFV